MRRPFLSSSSLQIHRVHCQMDNWFRFFHSFFLLPSSSLQILRVYRKHCRVDNNEATSAWLPITAADFGDPKVLLKRLFRWPYVLRRKCVCRVFRLYHILHITLHLSVISSLISHLSSLSPLISFAHYRSYLIHRTCQRTNKRSGQWWPKPMNPTWDKQVLSHI